MNVKCLAFYLYTETLYQHEIIIYFFFGHKTASLNKFLVEKSPNLQQPPPYQILTLTIYSILRHLQVPLILHVRRKPKSEKKNNSQEVQKKKIEEEEEDRRQRQMTELERENLILKVHGYPHQYKLY